MVGDAVDFDPDSDPNTDGVDVEEDGSTDTLIGDESDEDGFRESTQITGDTAIDASDAGGVESIPGNAGSGTDVENVVDEGVDIGTEDPLIYLIPPEDIS